MLFSLKASQALFSLLLKPVMHSSQNWSQVSEAIEELANCLHAYSPHLKIQNDVQKTNQESENPVRTLASDASVEHRHRTVFPHARYRALDAAVRDTEEPVFFDENEHTKNGFKDRKDWYIFYEISTALSSN